MLSEYFTMNNFFCSSSLSWQNFCYRVFSKSDFLERVLEKNFRIAVIIINFLYQSSYFVTDDYSNIHISQIKNEDFLELTPNEIRFNKINYFYNSLKHLSKIKKKKISNHCRRSRSSFNLCLLKILMIIN